MPGRRSFSDQETDFPDRIDQATPGPNSFKNTKILERNSPSEFLPSLKGVSSQKIVSVQTPSGLVKVNVFDPSADTPSVRDTANEVLSDIDSSEESDRASVRPRAVDRRRYSPVGSYFWPSTVVGASAQINRANKFKSNTLLCVDRVTRRQVLFAKRKAGKGYRTRKRRGPFSHIGC